MNYFSDKELACPCCGKLIFDSRFREDLNAARTFAGIPFHINSGYRCFKHNKWIGGLATSSHPKGLATDIRTASSRERYKVLFGLIMAGITRIGIGKNFIHADMDEAKPSEVMWTYYEEE